MDAPLVIGLVNSMPGEARGHAERQFRGILAAAARGRAVALRPFALGAGAPAPDGLPDGLIVTGAPPRAFVLAEEPAWRPLTELVDFALDHAMPAVWSCLAAHAAVFYLDGIERRRLAQKLSGVLACTRVAGTHPLMRGLPRRWSVPHSRCNDLPEDRLRINGYRILSRATGAGADIFAKDSGVPFVFCQGHPEYDAEALLREYRRDIRHYLAGERADYPAMPTACFSPGVAARLEAFRAQACRTRTPDSLAAFPTDACRAELRHIWGDVAVGLYANWLALVAQAKARRRRAAAGRAAGAAELPGR